MTENAWLTSRLIAWPPFHLENQLPPRYLRIVIEYYFYQCVYLIVQPHRPSIAHNALVPSIRYVLVFQPDHPALIKRAVSQAFLQPLAPGSRGENRWSFTKTSMEPSPGVDPELYNDVREIPKKRVWRHRMERFGKSILAAVRVLINYTKRRLLLSII